MPSIHRKRVGILVSGDSSLVEALIEAAKAPGYPAEIACVIADRTEGVTSLVAAASAGIRQAFVFSKDRGREDYEATLHHTLVHEFKVDLVALAGYKLLLTPQFVACFPNNIINIHPALLPAFPGLGVHRRVIEAGCKVSGCTVHIVDEGDGTGLIVAQTAVPVTDTDTPATLATRVAAAQRTTYPAALADFAAGRLYAQGRRVLRD